MRDRTNLVRSSLEGNALAFVVEPQAADVCHLDPFPVQATPRTRLDDGSDDGLRVERRRLAAVRSAQYEGGEKEFGTHMKTCEVA